MIADPRPPRRRLPRYVGFGARLIFDIVIAFLFVYAGVSIGFAVDGLIHP